MWVVVAALLTLQAWGGSDDPCKGFKVKADEFSGGTNVTAEVQGLSQLRAVGMTVMLHGANVELTILVKEGGASQGTVPAGVQMPFKFEDGTVSTWATTKESIAKADVTSSAVIMTIIPFVFGLDAAQLASLAGSPVTAIRIPLTTGQNYDWETNKGVQDTLRRAAVCVQSHLPK